MTHTALTADEAMRCLRGLATAGKEPPVFGDRREIPMFWDPLLEFPAHRGLAEGLACRDVLTPAPPRPTAVARVWTWLAALIRRLGRSPGNPAVGRVVPATDAPVAK